jgi:hypothetical protein
LLPGFISINKDGLIIVGTRHNSNFNFPPVLPKLNLQAQLFLAHCSPYFGRKTDCLACPTALSGMALLIGCPAACG